MNISINVQYRMFASQAEARFEAKFSSWRQHPLIEPQASRRTEWEVKPDFSIISFFLLQIILKESLTSLLPNDVLVYSPNYNQSTCKESRHETLNGVSRVGKLQKCDWLAAVVKLIIPAQSMISKDEIFRNLIHLIPSLSFRPHLLNCKTDVWIKFDLRIRISISTILRPANWLNWLSWGF